MARYKAGWERRDPDSIMELFAENAQYRDDPFADELAGSNAIRSKVNDVCAQTANVEFDAERVWVSGATILSSFHSAYTLRSNGKRVRQRGFLTMELDDAQQIWRFRQWAAEREVGTDSTFKVEE
jgi:hypothetical protein